MLTCPTKGAIRARVSALKRDGMSVVLVPTMGFLHNGHLALVRAAAKLADNVIVSIFVNPTQFGPNEDLEAYPRDPDRDLALLRDEGVDAVFLPSVEEMYGAAGDTLVDVPELSSILQGALRPDHFRGVATVVTKLFNVVQPDTAVFGEKDYQQLALIRQMVRDLDMPLTIASHPTVREMDGLAMSSRNVRLTPGHRVAATVLYKALCLAELAVLNRASIEDLEALIRDKIETESSADIQSVAVRDATTLGLLTGELRGPAVALLAVRFGSVLLIDQRVILPTTPSASTDAGLPAEREFQ